MKDGLSYSTALARLLQHWVGTGRVVGGVVLVAAGGRIVGGAVSGWADRERRIPMRRDTVMRLASMTKLVASVAALRLHEEGILALDDAVTRWLPWFRPALPDGSTPDITLRHLLSHCAGLGYGFEMPPDNPYVRAGVSDGLACDGITLKGNLQRLASVPLFFEPGTGWRYSLATDVLGAVMEAASGERLSEIVARKVLGPVGMPDTGFGVNDSRGVGAAYWATGKHVARIGATATYPVDAGLCRLSESRVLAGGGYHCAGAGLVGTADDYMRLLLCLRTGGRQVLSFESTASLLAPATGDLPIGTRGPGWAFGLGPLILTDPEVAGQRQGKGTWSWCGVHGGHYWVDPQYDLALVALTNTGTTGAWGDFADQLVDVIYDVL